MYLPHGYIYASLGSRHTKDFGNQIRINLEVRGRSRAFVCVHPPLAKWQGTEHAWKCIKI